MTRQQLFKWIKSKRSYLCVGLDTDLELIPKHLLEYDDPVFEFNKAIIEATADLCVAYKPNIAFYEALGSSGWNSLRKTIEHIPKEIFTIADAKRGDMGNSSRMYAKAFFDHLGFDAITVNPYMGKDSVEPFLELSNKWVILLALTSNSGSQDFQRLELKDSKKLYQKILEETKSWAVPDALMYVVGATQAGALKEVRRSVPDHFLLIPGVGAQGGNLEEVSRLGMNSACGLLVNSSRGIIYASEGIDFAQASRKAARKIQQEMARYLDTYLPFPNA